MYGALELPLKIAFDEISVQSMTGASGIFTGLNSQYGWSSHSKTNSGLGTIGGSHNHTYQTLNFVSDDDRIDTSIDDRDIIWGNTISTSTW